MKTLKKNTFWQTFNVLGIYFIRYFTDENVS